MTKIDLPLACGHKATFGAPYPASGSEMYCLKCNRETWVIGQGELTSRAKCQGCQYGRSFGADHSNALRTAGRHAMKSGHVVNVIKGGEVTAIDPSGEQGQLPYAALTQQRQETRLAAQQALRRFLNRPVN